MVQRTLIRPPRSRLGPVTAKERAIIRSVSPVDGKYDETIDRESAAEVLAAKAEDAAETADESPTRARRRFASAPASGRSLWGKALSRGVRTAAGSGAAIAAGAITGRTSRANPVRSGVTSAAGSIASDLAGPIAGRFVRNLIGGLMR